MAVERTLLLVKPDGVRRGLVGDVLRRFERKGFSIRGLKMLKLTPEMAEKHYAVHIGKPFFESLVEFITSGPIVAMVLEGNDVIALSRILMGATNPFEAEMGSIRGDYANQMQQNIVHGSDSLESAAYEIPIYFNESELI